MAASVQFQHVSVSYGPQTALRDVSLEITAGQIFAIIGPANSGKTTLLKCINRTIDFVPSARVQGQVLVGGEDVYRMRNAYALRRRVGMVFPLPVGLPLTVFDNVAYAPRRAGLRDRDALETLVEKCLRQAMLWDEVKDRLNTLGTKLSGGQQQRLCLARVLALNPEVILLDEPTSGLDPISTAKIEDALTLLKEQYTIVLVTNNTMQAGRVADTTAFFFMGELIEHDETKKIFTNPAQQRTLDYVTGRFG